jgi:hypothetical protein
VSNQSTNQPRQAGVNEAVSSLSNGKWRFGENFKGMVDLTGRWGLADRRILVPKMKHDSLIGGVDSSELAVTIAKDDEVFDCKTCRSEWLES